jgi:hypothetical protein
MEMCNTKIGQELVNLILLTPNDFKELKKKGSLVCLRKLDVNVDSEYEHYIILLKIVVRHKEDCDEVLNSLQKTYGFTLADIRKVV